jgi:hypothetical protein
MRYHYSIIAIVGASLITASAATFVSAQAPSGPGVFGFFDAASGTFRPVTLQQMPSSTGAEPRATVSRTGRIRFRIKIAVKNGSDPSFLPSCQGSFSHQGVLHSYSEAQSVQGTRVGNDAECVILINYRWPQANDANPVNVSIFASISSPSRSHSQSLAPIPLPPNNDLTGITVNINL